MPRRRRRCCRSAWLKPLLQPHHCQYPYMVFVLKHWFCSFSCLRHIWFWIKELKTIIYSKGWTEFIDKYNTSKEIKIFVFLVCILNRSTECWYYSDLRPSYNYHSIIIFNLKLVNWFFKELLFLEYYCIFCLDKLCKSIHYLSQFFVK